MKNVKLVRLDNFSTKADEDRGVIEFSGYAATFDNVDKGNDVIRKGAFVDSLRTVGMPKALWNHDWWEPVGAIKECREDDKGLYIKGELPLNDTLVAGRLVPQMQVGSIDSMSIGYWPRVTKYDEDTDIRELLKVDLIEVSFTAFPMNPEARVALEKSLVSASVLVDGDGIASADIKFDHDAAIDRIYKKSGIKYDITVCDVVDDKVMVIPRGVVQLKAAVAGASDLLDGMPDKAIEQARLTVERYSDKIEGVSGVSQFGKKELEMLPLGTASKVVEKGLLNKSAVKSTISGLVNKSIDKGEPKGYGNDEKAILEEIRKLGTITKKGD